VRVQAFRLCSVESQLTPRLRCLTKLLVNKNDVILQCRAIIGLW
jgi:hypothetical protein